LDKVPFAFRLLLDQRQGVAEAGCQRIRDDPGTMAPRGHEAYGRRFVHVANEQVPAVRRRSGSTSSSAIIGYFVVSVDWTAPIAQTWTGRLFQAMVDMVVDQRALRLRYGLLYRVELAGDVDLPPRS
jgi:hypothetical protein